MPGTQLKNTQNKLMRWRSGVICFLAAYKIGYTASFKLILKFWPTRGGFGTEILSMSWQVPRDEGFRHMSFLVIDLALQPQMESGNPERDSRCCFICLFTLVGFIC